MNDLYQTVIAPTLHRFHTMNLTQGYVTPPPLTKWCWEYFRDKGIMIQNHQVKLFNVERWIGKRKSNK